MTTLSAFSPVRRLLLWMLALVFALGSGAVPAAIALAEDGGGGAAARGVAPQDVTFVSPSPASGSPSNGPVYRFTVGNVSFNGARCFINNNQLPDAINCAPNTDITIPTSGLVNNQTYVFRVDLRSGGTVVGSGSTTFTYDKTLPDLTVTSEPKDGAVLNAIPTYTFGASDAYGAVTVRCAVDDGASGPCTTTNSYQPTGIADGDHTVTITATDRAGNIRTRQRTFTLDRVSPAAPGFGQDSTDVGAVTGAPTFTFTTSENDINRFRCVFDDPQAQYFICANAATPSYTPPASTLSTLGDGTHTLYVRAVDKAGNNSTANSRPFVLDTTKPSVTFDADATTDGALVNSAPSYPFTVNDDSELTDITCTLDPGPLTMSPCASPFTPSVANRPDGTYTVTVSATDKAGNTESTSRTFTLDQTLPVVVFNSTSPDDTARVNTAPTYDFTVSDSNLDEVSCSLDSTTTFTACTASYTPSTADLGQGPHTVRVKVVDKAGNETTTSRTFVWDTAPPVVEFAASAPIDGTSVSSAPTYDFTATDPGPLTTTCSLDSTTDYSPCNGFYTPSTANLSQGLHTVRVKAVDQAGNETVGSRTFVYDTIGPAVTITGGLNDGSTARRAVSYTFASSAADLAGYECRIDARPWSDCVSGGSFSTSGLGQGRHTFEVRAVDTTGNPGEPASRWFLIDDVPPSVVVDGGPADGATVTSAPTYTFYATGDDVADKDCRIDGGAWFTCSSPYTVDIDGLAGGRHTIDFRGFDRSGNIGEPTTRTFVLDTGEGPVDPEPDIEGPTTTFGSGPADGAIVSAEPRFGFVSAAEDLALFECAVDDGDFVTCTSPFTPAAGEGTHTLAVRGLDETGNEGEVVTRTWTLETAPDTGCEDAQDRLERSLGRRGRAVELLAKARESGKRVLIERAKARLATARGRIQDARADVADAC